MFKHLKLLQSDYITAAANTGDIYCEGDSSCAVISELISSGRDTYCRGYFSCYSSPIVSRSDTYCESISSCRSSTITSISNTYCRGYQSCYGSSIVSVNNVFCGSQQPCFAASIRKLTDSSSTIRIYGYSYQSVAYGDINTEDGILSQMYLYGYGEESFEFAQIKAYSVLGVIGHAKRAFYRATINKMTNLGDVAIYGYASYAFEEANIYSEGTINYVYLYSEYSGNHAKFNLRGSSESFVEVYGYFGARNATFNVSSPTAQFKFCGFYAGSEATVNCGATSTCNITCCGNGCNGLTLNCANNNINECIVDESTNIDCPNGYVGPTPQPAGGSTETVICDETEECAGIQSLYGTTVECSGTQSCTGAGSIAITSLSGINVVFIYFISYFTQLTKN